jgi:hypothetical protein
MSRPHREPDLLSTLRTIQPGLPPELAGSLEGLDTGSLPPGALVARSMRLPVRAAAERDHEFVAHLAAERARLGEAQSYFCRCRRWHVPAKQLFSGVKLHFIL